MSDADCDKREHRDCKCQQQKACKTSKVMAITILSLEINSCLLLRNIHDIAVDEIHFIFIYHIYINYLIIVIDRLYSIPP